MSNASAITSGEFALPTTVETLREQLGGRQRWWGDLSAAEARELYHSLLPWYLLDDRLSSALSLSERARLAVTARHAARLYVRERALLPVAFGCELFDGARQLWEHGTFQPQGMSEEQVWQKYAEAAGLSPDDASCYQHEDICQTILEKACTTNKQVDMLVGCLDSASQAAEEVAQSMGTASHAI